MTVQNSHGFGVVGWNLLGDAYFSRVNFLSNSPESCIFELSDHHDRMANLGIGDGAFILYEDFDESGLTEYSENSLVFDKGLIANNFGCQHGLGSSIFNQLFLWTASNLNNNYIGAAGGISIIFGQSSYRINASIDSCTFRNNSNVYGGAGMMILVYELANSSNVYVTDSTFLDNGVSDRNELREQLPGMEGALFILYHVPISTTHLSKELLSSFLSHLPSTVHIQDTLFMNNSAETGGGLCVLSFSPSQSLVQDQLNLRNCIFISNVARHGSAMYATEITYSGFENGLRVSLHDINITRNGGKLDAVSINQLNVSVSGMNVFESNRATALSLQRAVVKFSGSCLFRRNSANRGGAIRIKSSDSYLVVQNKSDISFVDNDARIAGGAIFVSFDLTSPVLYDCFLFVEEFNPLCHLIGGCSSYGVSIDFTNNTAPLGSAIYGSTLYHCAWSNGVHYIIHDNRSAHETAQDVIDSLNSADAWLQFNPSVNNHNNVINTLPKFIVTESHDFDLSFNVTPGGHFILRVRAFDYLLQAVPVTILSNIYKNVNREVSTASSSVGDTNRYLLEDSGSYTEVPVNVFGAEDTNHRVVIRSTETRLSFDVSVHLVNCSTGFRFNNDSTRPTCECHINDVLLNVQCNNDGTVTRAYNHWIGVSEAGNYIYEECVFNYCNNSVTKVSLDSPDKQCAHNQAGILCGDCLPGYSRTLGSTRCQICSNNNGLWLISLFAVLGVLLVIMIKFLNITVTDGYINGFIFYGNIVNIYFTGLSVNQVRIISPLFAVMASLNLNFGFEVCFFHDMKQWHLMFLTLLFPIYLLGILLVIVLFTEYTNINLRNVRKWISWRKGRETDEITTVGDSEPTKSSNIIQVLVTLYIISFTSIIQVCFDIIGCIIIRTPSGRDVRWIVNPNHKCFAGIHILLAIVSLGLLLLLIPFSILMTFPSFILRWHITNKLKPLIDAITAPFRDKCRFWLGFQLNCRLVIYFCITNMGGTGRYLVLAILLLLILVVQASIWPYKTTGRNLLDLSLMLNLTLVAVITLFIQPLSETWNRNVLVIFTTILVFQLLLLICYYVIITFSCTRKICESFKKKGTELMKRMKYRGKRTPTNGERYDSDFQSQNQASANDAGNQWNSHLDSRTFNFLRETLLEEPATEL